MPTSDQTISTFLSGLDAETRTALTGLEATLTPISLLNALSGTGTFSTVTAGITPVPYTDTGAVDDQYVLWRIFQRADEESQRSQSAWLGVIQLLAAICVVPSTAATKINAQYPGIQQVLRGLMRRKASDAPVAAPVITAEQLLHVRGALAAAVQAIDAALASPGVQ